MSKGSLRGRSSGCRGQQRRLGDGEHAGVLRREKRSVPCDGLGPHCGRYIQRRMCRSRGRRGLVQERRVPEKSKKENVNPTKSQKRSPSLLGEEWMEAVVIARADVDDEEKRCVDYVHTICWGETNPAPKLFRCE